MIQQGEMATNCRLNVSGWASGKKVTKKVMQHGKMLSSRALCSPSLGFSGLRQAKPRPISAGVGASPTQSRGLD